MPPVDFLDGRHARSLPTSAWQAAMDSATWGVHMSFRQRVAASVSFVAVAAWSSLQPGITLGASPGASPVAPESSRPAAVTSSPAESAAPSRGFASPEDAVTAYIAAV